MAAKDIGYPVVLKLLAAEVQHKSDIGGVMLGIRSDNELRARLYAAGAEPRQGQARRQARTGDRRRAGVRRRRAGARRAARSRGRPGGDVRLRRRQSGAAQGRRLRRGAAAAVAGQGDDRAHHRGQAAQGLSRHAGRRRRQRAGGADRARPPCATISATRSRASTSIRSWRCRTARARSRSTRWWCCGVSSVSRPSEARAGTRQRWASRVITLGPGSRSASLHSPGTRYSASIIEVVHGQKSSCEYLRCLRIAGEHPRRPRRRHRSAN